MKRRYHSIMVNPTTACRYFYCGITTFYFRKILLLQHQCYQPFNLESSVIRTIGCKWAYAKANL
jgi:hypothetical protein